MHKNFLATAAILGASGVAFGAFGAHGLKQIVSAETVQTFQTGVQYQMYHALALLAVAILHEKLPMRFMKLSGAFFITGIILFSGSLYLLTVFKATDTVGVKGVGIITPVGGLFFIAGWLMLLIAAWKRN